MEEFEFLNLMGGAGLVMVAVWVW